MGNILYTATERFSSKNGDAWTKYIEWSKLDHISEVVSLDSMLCSSSISSEYSETDWKYQSEEDNNHGFFTDLNHVLTKGINLNENQIIGLIKNPEDENWVSLLPGKFVLKGYDLIDDETLISALSNCGGFPETFSNTELNKFALLPNLLRAIQIKDLLIRNNPKEAHANCEIYGIARLEEAKPF
jgi:hypothetical protein